MEKVKFTQMKDGDKEDYDLLSNFEEKHIKGTADRVIRVLKSLDTVQLLLQIRSRYSLLRQ